MAQGTIDHQGDWVKLCELPDRVRATMAQDLLASGDIESMLVDQTDSMYPMIGTVIGRVRNNYWRAFSIEYIRQACGERDSVRISHGGVHTV